MKSITALALIIVVIAIIDPAPDGPAAPPTAPPANPKLAAFMAPHPDQAAVLGHIASAATAYDTAANDLAKGGVMRDRATAICASLPDLRATDWTGTIETLTTNSEGRGVVTLRIADDVTLGTWNNAISDIGANTLLDPDSEVFKTLATLQPGDPVKFTAQLVAAAKPAECLTVSNLTMDGKMNRPQLVARMLAVSTFTP